MPEILPHGNNRVIKSLNKFCEECARHGCTDCIDHGGVPSEDTVTSVLGKRHGSYRDAYVDFLIARDDVKNLFSPSLKRSVPPSSGLSRTDILSHPLKQVFPTVPAVSTPSALHLEPATPAVSCEISPSSSGPDTPSDHSRDKLHDKIDQDNDDTGYREGGVRYRENLRKFVVEYRPPRFKWKLWMGTYLTIDEGRRACDCARYYAGHDKGGFYFKDSPALFQELGPLNRPFTLVNKDFKDKAFNMELKKRAKLVIKKVLDAQRANQVVDVSRPTPSMPLSKADIEQRLLAPNARANPSYRNSAAHDPLSVVDRLPTSRQESVAKPGPAREPFAIIDGLPTSSQESLSISYPEYERLSSCSQESSEITGSRHEEAGVAQCPIGITLEAGDTYAGLDPLDATLDPREFVTAFIDGYNIVLDHHPSASNMDNYVDDAENAFDVQLWHHEF
ncbi:uncharacterized protein [Physcomitrium patens]|uniref:AP2/ERF domain-containing protein n=1 Tax=Physcomitrium patens TaxID=3218 RepID=A9RC34_PHYPA|nr:uncharacterized protein LOC112279325 [Physcomitrium patens]XP_024369435.1 uncharacterized protein LOC112279325 [Physcomitrium patens]XP_024369436.1 uncharacterized protein LOC112279325 [Physcomitrium patens]PNR57085.1 hypothetical protein PHYPA_004078 [Physcomitrium patens]|eukprot:XP_024369434.1 uncharacterized protein LOC112279325 [Physcomitrella patens]